MNTSFDAGWHKQALAGKPAAIDALAAAMLEPLYRFCLYRVGCDRHLCEDVVQETLVEAIKQISHYDPARSGGDIFGWLVGLARNNIRKALAGRNAASLEALWLKMDKEVLGLCARLDSESLADEVLARQETRQLVNAAMSQLPPQYGQALEAKYLLGRSVREIALTMQTTEKAVESLLTRARKAFKEVFMALTKNLSVEAG